MERLTFILASFSLFTTALSLSCYTCENELYNEDCVDSRQLCKEFQDTCTSYISWRIAPDATLKGERTYSIYKGCDTRTGCARRKGAIGNHCGSRGYTFDWACVECCEGDLCNYEVERYKPWWYWSSASRPSSVTLILTACVTVIFMVIN